VRSGNNLVSSYIDGSVNSWYNLRLIPETEDDRIGIDSVQRLSVYTEGPTQVFTRRNREWVITGLDVTKPDQGSIEAYIRAVIGLEGDDFNDTVTADDPMLNQNRFVLEFGNTNVRTIRLSDADESNRRLAHISGSDYVYSVASWAAQRLFKTASDFETR
jgi:hypothetical protein